MSDFNIDTLTQSQSAMKRGSFILIIREWQCPKAPGVCEVRLSFMFESSLKYHLLVMRSSFLKILTM